MNKALLILSIIFVYAYSSIGQESISDEVLKKYEDLLQGFENEEEPGGVVLVSKSGEIIFQKAFGKANLELDVDMKIDHRIHIASNGKPFTAIAILKLFEDGKLSLQDDIRKYITYYPKTDQRITIEHLLTHTSGMPHNPTSSLEELSKVSKKDYTMEEYISLFGNCPLLYVPGTKKSYSNPGYVILGSIIAKVSKMSYDQYLNQIFFEPLGMKNTILADTDKVIKNRVTGYTKVNDEFVNATYESKIFTSTGDGGYLSTVQDLNIWYNAIFNYEVINKETLDFALKPYKRNGMIISTGYVWPMDSYKNSIKLGHTGLSWGVASNVKYYPKEKVLAVGLLNCNSCAFQNDYAFYKAIHRFSFIAMENEFWENEYPKEMDINDYVGVYKTKIGKEKTIGLFADRLYQQMEDGKTVELFYLGDGYFFNQDNFEHFKFILTKKGKVKALESTQIETLLYEKQ